MPSDTSPLFASLDGLRVTPWIRFEDFMVTSGMKVPPWAWALWCVLLISLQDRRPNFPSCQQTLLNMKPSSRIALAEEALCPIPLSLPKCCLQTMTGQCRAIRPLLSPQLGANPAWELLVGQCGESPALHHRPVQSCSLPFVSVCIDPETPPQEASCMLILSLETVPQELPCHRVPSWPGAFACIYS